MVDTSDRAEVSEETPWRRSRICLLFGMMVTMKAVTSDAGGHLDGKKGGALEMPLPLLVLIDVGTMAGAVGEKAVYSFFNAGRDHLLRMLHLSRCELDW